ncbi:MAG: type II toxin-antitoxin system HicB family antitoxin [Rhodoferax sp.]|nr:type II toxin-antitoxin system HicB family antitoxin [Rhodoferax sp.]
MLYPVYVHPGDEAHSHGAQVPDFPGCFSAADDLQELPRKVQEAVEVWFDGEDLDLPAPSGLDSLALKSDYTGGCWMLIDIDTSRLDLRSNKKPMRINISMPADLVHDIDLAARASGATRSGFLAKAARQAMSV